MDWKLAVKTFFLTGSVGFLLGLSGAKLAWCSYQMWYENRGTNKTLIWRPKFLHNTQGLRSATWSVLSLLGLTSLSGWDIDVQLAGAQICVVSGSTDRNGRLWIVWIWITWVIHSNSLGQKMRSLLHRSVKGSSSGRFLLCLGSGFKHRPPVWDVAMSMLWMKRLSPWQWIIFSNLVKKGSKATICAMVELLVEIQASKEGCWKESEICASSFPETQLASKMLQIDSCSWRWVVLLNNLDHQWKSNGWKVKPGKAREASKGLKLRGYHCDKLMSLRPQVDMWFLVVVVTWKLLSPGSTTCEKQTVLDLSLFVQRHPSVLSVSQIKRETNRKFPCHRTVVIIAIAVRIWSIEKTRRPGRVFASFVSVCGVWTREFFSAHMKACERWQYDMFSARTRRQCPFCTFAPWTEFCYQLSRTKKLASTFGSTKVLKMFPVAFYTSRCIKVTRVFHQGKHVSHRFVWQNWLHSLYC